MKISQYLISSFFLIFSCVAYPGDDYFINFYNLSKSTITITPIYHYCVYAFSNQSITIEKWLTGGIKIRANNSGACAFYDAYEQFDFTAGNLKKGWIKFYMGNGGYDSGTNSSGDVFDNGDYGQDFTNRWTFYSDNDETTMVTFW